jgi:glycosyltransferase involved in cell wall biosynthesis
MRVLHIGSGNLYGGVETYFATLANLRHLCPTMEPEFALCFTGRLSQELQVLNVQVHLLDEVRVRFPWTIARARRVLKDLMRQRSYDAVICHSAWLQAIFGPVVRRTGGPTKIPLVFYLHCAAKKSHWLEHWAARVIPDYVICNSRYTQSTLGMMYPGVRNDVAYFPVIAPQEINLAERMAVRAELQTPADAVVIIQASRMEPWKGHNLLLQSLAALPRNANWVAWIVGGGQRPREVKYMARLKEKAREFEIASRLRFTAQRNDVARLLSAADIFCQPNRTPEPFGIAFVEALSAGLPVITTASGGALEVVDDLCGTLVPPNDAPALTAALGRMLTDPELRRKLGNHAPLRAQMLCSPEKQMKALERLLSSGVGYESEVCCDRQYA